MAETPAGDAPDARALELAAMAQLDDVLRALSPQAALRVLDWLRARMLERRPSWPAGYEAMDPPDDLIGVQAGPTLAGAPRRLRPVPPSDGGA